MTCDVNTVAKNVGLIFEWLLTPPRGFTPENIIFLSKFVKVSQKKIQKFLPSSTYLQSQESSIEQAN